MNSRPLPNLAAINWQLAGNVNRVTAFIDTLPVAIDKLVAAATKQDWAEVSVQSEILAAAGEACDLKEISVAAKAVQEAIAADNQLLTGRAVVRLVGRCGSIKMPKNETQPKLN